MGLIVAFLQKSNAEYVLKENSYTKFNNFKHHNANNSASFYSHLEIVQFVGNLHTDGQQLVVPTDQGLSETTNNYHFNACT